MKKVVVTIALFSLIGVLVIAGCASDEASETSGPAATAAPSPTDADFRPSCWFQGERIDNVMDSEGGRYSLVKGSGSYGQGVSCWFQAQTTSFDPYSVTVAFLNTYLDDEDLDFVVGIGQAFEIERVESGRSPNLPEAKVARWILGCRLGDFPYTGDPIRRMSEIKQEEPNTLFPAGDSTIWVKDDTPMDPLGALRAPCSIAPTWEEEGPISTTSTFLSKVETQTPRPTPTPRTPRTPHPHPVPLPVGVSSEMGITSDLAHLPSNHPVSKALSRYEELRRSYWEMRYACQTVTDDTKATIDSYEKDQEVKWDSSNQRAHTLASLLISDSNAGHPCRIETNRSEMLEDLRPGFISRQVQTEANLRAFPDPEHPLIAGSLKLLQIRDQLKGMETNVKEAWYAFDTAATGYALQFQAETGRPLIWDKVYPPREGQ